MRLDGRTLKSNLLALAVLYYCTLENLTEISISDVRLNLMAKTKCTLIRKESILVRILHCEIPIQNEEYLTNENLHGEERDFLGANECNPGEDF